MILNLPEILLHVDEAPADTQHTPTAKTDTIAAVATEKDGTEIMTTKTGHRAPKSEVL